jgi:hypothetical protein
MPTHPNLSAKNDKGGNASKPLSLHPLKFKAAVTALLKVKPPKPEQ